jgi:hypothetical protein
MHASTLWTVFCFVLATGALINLCALVARKLRHFRL